MDIENKIEFYKVRSIGERFSVAGDFVRQNWKLLAKNIFYPGAILAIIHGFLSQKYMQGTMTNITSQMADPSFLISVLWLMIVSIVLFLFIYSMTGAIMYQYANNKLADNAGWNDLKSDMFSIMGKIFIQGLILSAIALLIFLVLGGIALIPGFGISSIAGAMLSALMFLLFLVLIIVLIPSLSLTTYPIYFEQLSPWNALTKGFRLGFKNWGAIFLTVFLGTLLAMAIYYIISMPYLVYTVFTIETGGGFIGYVLAAISSLLIVIVYPILNIFIGFQYTSIIEKEEGISMQEKIEDFSQL